jgi:hypothetical protein
MSEWLRFFELYVVLTFAAAWGILEWVAKRYDRIRERGEPTKGDQEIPSGAEKENEQREY